MTRPRRLPRFDGVITGHNTDVEYAGRVYHIQTEDKGRRNPLIETLIYSKGEILDTRRSSYSDIAEEGYSETEIIRRMDEQHRRSVRDVGNGWPWSCPPPWKPAGRSRRREHWYA
ncbi:MAG: hypothetical protein DMF49_06495 [Acidobacteria bacterium]|nr:MAG: hypothetical protein DMF49_06495 [Acidobacteriota bacterium]